MSTQVYIPDCIRGGDHEELLRDAAADRARQEYDIKDSAVICMRCTKRLPFTLLEQV